MTSGYCCNSTLLHRDKHAAHTAFSQSAVNLTRPKAYMPALCKKSKLDSEVFIELRVTLNFFLFSCFHLPRAGYFSKSQGTWRWPVPNTSKDQIDKESSTTKWIEALTAPPPRPHPLRALQDACPNLPKPRLLLGNQISAATGTGRSEAAWNVRGRAHAASLGSAETGIHSVPVAMKTGHTPAIPAGTFPVRRRARRPAHEQCGLKPASPSLRRQLRRCGCHYGPLQSEGGAA